MSCLLSGENESILSTKRNAMFSFAFLGLKIIDFKNCFNSVILPSNKDLDCIVSSLIEYRALFRE